MKLYKPQYFLLNFRTVVVFQLLHPLKFRIESHSAKSFEILDISLKIPTDLPGKTIIGHSIKFITFKISIFNRDSEKRPCVAFSMESHSAESTGKVTVYLKFICFTPTKLEILWFLFFAQNFSGCIKIVVFSAESTSSIESQSSNLCEALQLLIDLITSSLYQH